ncbi:MAG: chemotaxis protein CheB [Myxococcales bacterium]|nr:chemotaxis protein CheB [Myxococcales bacterium]
MTVRVLIVDDSAFFREVLRAELAGWPEVEVVGEAGDGARAIELARALRPDVVTMDVVLPLVGGLEAIRAIMAERPTAIVVLSRLVGHDARLALDAIAAGALELIEKPTAGFDASAVRRLVELLTTVAASQRIAPARPTPVAAPRLPRAPAAQIVGVVASTGGPQLLRALLAALPATYPLPIAIVQHTTAGFVAPLVSWLGDTCALPVTVAQVGQRVAGGQVVVAPDDLHLTIDRDGRVRLGDGPREAGHRPSGTALLRALARGHGAAVVGLVLSGMGKDGADGLAAVAAAGGVAIVQDPADAAIDAMPRAALAAVPTATVATAAALPGLLLAAARSPAS